MPSPASSDPDPSVEEDVTTQTYTVSGMTCDHCVAAVTEEVQALDGVSAVEIDLATEGSSTVRVTSEAALELAAVRAAVDEAGYELVGRAG